MIEDISRPDPDQLLEQIKTEETQKNRGKLKIFLGYAAGVGKTFTMLEAARNLKKDIDVVVAYVETHGRIETEALLSGLEILPRKHVDYHNTVLPEMDLDALLKRHPQLTLIDELAHTNLPSARHPKRYQDVEEILDAGIDVYTTLNIQHIESLRNVVAQITGVWIRETVPDSIFNKAEVELVDLPPSELLKRLREGKVYVPEQIIYAVKNFFREGNLTALRELAMRTASEYVDEQMRSYMESHSVRSVWPTTESLLVCINREELETGLIRAAKRLATQLNAEWYVINVEAPGNIVLSSERQRNLANTLKLAEKLGAEVITVQGVSVASTSVEYARTHNIAKIIVSKPRYKGLNKLIRRSITNQIIHEANDIDVYVINTRGEEEPSEKKDQETNLASNKIGNWRGYLYAMGLVVVATLLSYLIRSFFAPTNLIMVYLLCVLITAVFCGIGPSIFASILSVLAFDFFFINPRLSFTVNDTQYIFTFITLLIVGFIISYFTARMRRQTEAVRQREKETLSLYTMSKNLAIAVGFEAIVHAIIQSTSEIYESNVAIFLRDGQKESTLKPYKEKIGLIISENEIAAATWAFEHKKMVGYGTDTLPDAKALYLPMITARGIIGVMGIWISETKTQLTAGQLRLLHTFADLAATALELNQLAEEAHNLQMLEITEKLQNALLNSISHDLRTPLVSIIGVLSSLQDEGFKVNDADKENLIQVAREEAERLNHLITNLLDVTRIDSGVIKLLRQPSDLQELVSVALEQLGDHTGNHQIKINISNELPFVNVDFGLIVQVLYNILDNALKYSPDDSPIEIIAHQIKSEIEVNIADRGIGIPPEYLQRVFDKFYRVHRPDQVSGTGLGLSICKGIIEAHGGNILAENRDGGGTIIKFTLPITNGKLEV